MDKNEEWSFKTSDLFTVPNILTYIRIVLIIPFAYFFLNECYLPAAICIVVSGLTDCFDGMIARKFNQVTSLGKLLDPVADKLTLLSVVVCMVFNAPMVLPVLIILFIKDLLMLIGGSNLIKKGLTPPAAKWYGKLATIIFYFSVCIIVFLMITDNSLPVLEHTLLFITAVAMLYALYRYGKIYFAMINAHKAELAKKENFKN